MTRHWEYANTFLFEFPIQLYTLFRCFANGISPYTLVKANWVLDHGGVGASKYDISTYFSSHDFLKYHLLPTHMPLKDKLVRAKTLGFPLMIKPDYGRVGRGIVKVDTHTQLKEVLLHTHTDVVVQEYSDHEYEYGVFYVRQHGVGRIFSINSKELPYVIGDGFSTITELVTTNERLNRFVDVLSEQLDWNRVPKKNEHVQLSYIGNHAQGSVFYDVTDLATPEFLARLEESIPEGFNYGRFDITAQSPHAFKQGTFKIIEVNGVDSLTTAIFDPSYSLWDAYKILIKQYGLLIRIAREHRHVKMPRKPFIRFFKDLFAKEEELAQAHERSLAFR